MPCFFSFPSVFARSSQLRFVIRLKIAPRAQGGLHCLRCLAAKRVGTEVKEVEACALAVEEAGEQTEETENILLLYVASFLGFGAQSGRHRCQKRNKGQLPAAA